MWDRSIDTNKDPLTQKRNSFDRSRPEDQKPVRDSLLKGIAAGSNSEVVLDLEFGRTSMSTENVNQLEGGSIIPLPDNPNGNVQIIWDKRTIAEGTLMIFEGKLAIRVNKMTPVGL